MAPETLAPALAGFWRRSGAFIVDAIILVAVDQVIRDTIGASVERPLGIVLALTYATLLVGSRGQTIGMQALKIRVIGVGTSDAIGYKRAFIRWIGVVISAAALFVGFLWMIWDREKQCWHDKFASDLVVLAF